MSIFDFLKKKKPYVFTVADLPPGYTLEQNSLGEYRARPNTGHELADEFLITREYINPSDAIRQAIGDQEYLKKSKLRGEWKKVEI